MRNITQTILAVLAVFAVVTAGAGNAAAQATYPLNTSADEHPDTYFSEDRLTIETHNQSTMGWLEYEDDNGKIQTIQAHVNGSKNGAKVSYRADQLADSDLNQFPRTDSEDGNNSVTWTNAGDWTVSTNAAVTDSDGSTASGVESIQITASSMTSGDTETATYSAPSITSDAEKRFLQAVLNVDQLDSGSVVEVRVKDGDGDYVAAEVNASRDATANDVIANGTANGVIFQEQLGQLTVEGSGDGSLDAVDSIEVVTTDANAQVTITGLNVEKKSAWDFGTERVPDTSTDDTDDYTDEVVRDRPNGGAIEAASLQGLGDWADDATVNKLTYLDVEYHLQDKPESVNANITDGENFPNYELLELTWTRTIPTAYDITHGQIELKTEQSLLSERYTKLRYAEGTGDKSTSEVSDSNWIDLTGSLGDEGKTITADSTGQSGVTYKFQLTGKLLPEQADNLEAAQQQGGGGFWGGSSSGGGPFSSMYNWVAGGVVGLLTMLGLKSKAGA